MRILLFRIRLKIRAGHALGLEIESGITMARRSAIWTMAI
jgi:hypothetical protein